MPLYDADGTSKQKPIVRDGTGFYSHAICPAHSTKTKKLFKELVKKLTMELLDEESLEEITTTAAVPGYMTPFAFSDGSKKDKKKKLKRIKKSTGYTAVTEALNDRDLKQINKLIRDVVGDILRDIWLKRNAWK